jgi:hypothetical protein
MVRAPASLTPRAAEAQVVDVEAVEHRTETRLLGHHVRRRELRVRDGVEVGAERRIVIHAHAPVTNSRLFQPNCCCAYTPTLLFSL